MHERNNDLILITFFGFIHHVIMFGFNLYLIQIPSIEHFTVLLTASVFMGLAIQTPSQMIEWPLCFLFGSALGALNIVPLLIIFGMNFNFHQMTNMLYHTLIRSSFLSSTIFVGLLISGFIRVVFDSVMGSLIFNKRG